MVAMKLLATLMVGFVAATRVDKLKVASPVEECEALIVTDPGSGDNCTRKCQHYYTFGSVVCPVAPTTAETLIDCIVELQPSCHRPNERSLAPTVPPTAIAACRQTMVETSKPQDCLLMCSTLTVELCGHALSEGDDLVRCVRAQSSMC